MSDPQDPSLDLAGWRENYDAETLRRSELSDDPILQLERWLQEAAEAEIQDANAMVLATATRDGVPSARIVLLKGLGSEGLVFFTNYESQKGQELKENPVAEVNFLWKKLHRQVRVRGAVERLSREDTQAYFAKRPRGSQIGAWSSPQSRVMDRRQDLERRAEEAEKRFRGTEHIPAPDFWGGYRLRPEAFEFWQGRPSRLHDRFRYRRLGDQNEAILRRMPSGSWGIERLAP